MADVKPIPPNYGTVTPSLTMNDAAGAIDFYKRALGAVERSRMDGPDGKIMHAELQIGSSMIMLNDEVMDNRSAKGLGGSPVAFYTYFDNADGAFKKAITAGGKELMPVTDMFWGDRMGQFEDPYGYRWNVAMRVKEMTHEEMKRAGEEWMRQMAARR
jgi:PhnB protein